MISFDHVTYAYEGKETPSLRDCTFSVKPGELILLTGESGCGKTTIIKLVNGLLQHSWRWDADGNCYGRRPGCGTNPAVGTGADGGLGVSEPQVPVLQSGHHRRGAFWAGESWASHDEMSRALDSAVKSAAWARSWIGVFLLCPAGRSSASPAPAHGPWGRRLFVLDEPSSNLDGEGIRQLRNILRRLKTAGKTVLMAEHRLWYAADLADRVFHLRGGQLQRNIPGRISSL